MTVSHTHPQYDAMLAEWSKMADVMTCESVIHAKGEDYLPKLSGMSDAAYDAYKKRASFIMFTKRTIEAFVGMVMRKDVELDGFSGENIDGKGGDIDSYVTNALDVFLTYGRCGTLVGMPAVGETLSVADAERMNVTPRLLFYGPNDIINWKTESIDNVKTLSLVVLREEINVSEDEFGHDYEYQYRVLDIFEGKYRQRLFDHNEELIETIFPLRQGEPLPFIPFKIHGGDQVKYPPLLSVADQNIHHYQKDADYQHGLHFTALPTPYIVGMDAEDPNVPKNIGPTTLWVLPENSSAGMLEFTGMGLGQISKAMETNVEIIVILASRILAPEKSSNDESALAAAIRSNAETSSLAGVVGILSKELIEAVRIMSWWNGDDPTKVKLVINSDFMPTVISGSDMLSFVTAWIKGSISYESLFNTLKRGEIIEGNRLMLDEIKAINKEQEERLKKEVEKAEKMGKAEGKAKEKQLAGERDPDPEQNIEMDRRIK